MTNMGLSNLKPLRVRHIIYDLDNCLFDYPDGYAENFSIETANSAIAIAQEKIINGQGNDRLNELANMDLHDVIQIALASYADPKIRDTTILFMRDYGINSVELYNHHHKTIVEKTVKPTFNKFVNPALQRGMKAINDLGIDQYLYTNGDEYYARETAKALDLVQFFKFIIGIDSANDFDYPKKGKIILTPKKIPSAWDDFLSVTGIPSQGQWIVGRDRADNPSKRDHNYDHCLFIDDGVENFKTPKEKFRMQTVLRQTERVHIDGKSLSDIDAIIDDVGAFTNQFASEVLRQRKSVRENPSVRPELKLLP